jgi:hypothetical protein
MKTTGSAVCAFDDFALAAVLLDIGKARELCGETAASGAICGTVDRATVIAAAGGPLGRVERRTLPA